MRWGLVPYRNMQTKCQWRVISIHSHSKWQSTFCRVYLHYCLELTNQTPYGIQQRGTKFTKCSWMGFDHGHVSIENATHSFSMWYWNCRRTNKLTLKWLGTSCWLSGYNLANLKLSATTYTGLFISFAVRAIVYVPIWKESCDEKTHCSDHMMNYVTVSFCL